MKKFIKTQDSLRVRIQYVKTFEHYNLRLQKKVLFFWIDTTWFVDVSDGFCGEDNCRDNPLRADYIGGGSTESYKTGTLNLNKRAKTLCDDYIKKQNLHLSNKKVLVNLEKSYYESK